jgi:indolepyruvate ferredoxin oxidoreductase beta subunit
MKASNILMVGVGGTGVLTAARILATAAMLKGHNVRMGEIHGMAQRGGAVVCTVRIGKGVRGPIIPTGTADLLLSIEPVEALRHVNKMSSDGKIVVGMYHITPTAVLLGRSQYPSDEEILKNLRGFGDVVTVDAVGIAEKAGNILTMNTVLIGAAKGLERIPVPKNTIISALKEVLPSRYHKVNIEAFELGMKAVSRT